MKKLILILLAFNLCFIFYQSALPVSVSSGESGFVTEEIVKPVYETVTGKEADFTDTLVRKAAHVTEYFSLGLLAAAFFGSGSLRRALKVCNYCVLTALADETLQIFTGRGSEIRDVWIDAFGAAAGILLALCICAVSAAVRKND